MGTKKWYYLAGVLLKRRENGLSIFEETIESSTTQWEYQLSGKQQILNSKGTDWLKIFWFQYLLHTKRSKINKVKKIIQSKGSKTSESLSKPIFTTSINQWHNILNNVEIDVINNELGDLYLTFLNK